MANRIRGIDDVQMVLRMLDDFSDQEFDLDESQSDIDSDLDGDLDSYDDNNLQGLPVLAHVCIVTYYLPFILNIEVNFLWIW